MSRSVWKGFFFCKNIKKKTIDLLLQKKKNISFFFFRNSTFLDKQHTFNFKVHNGKCLKKQTNISLICSKKAGEFSFTRKPYFFPIKKKK